jgi:hypothetical protein
MIALSDPESFSVAPVRRPPADQLKVEQKCIKSKGKKSSVGGLLATTVTKCETRCPAHLQPDGASPRNKGPDTSVWNSAKMVSVGNTRTTVSYWPKALQNMAPMSIRDESVPKVGLADGL